MKKKFTHFSGYYIEVLEKKLIKEHGQIKEKMRRKVIIITKKDHPVITKKTLMNYIGEEKAQYEKMAVDALKHLQSDAFEEEVKIKLETKGNNIKALNKEIGKLENEIVNMESEEFDEYINIQDGLKHDLFITTSLLVGEVIINVFSFQILGESLLFAILLSLSVSFAVDIYAHLVPLVYKEVEGKTKKIMVVVGAFILALILFIVLATLRSMFFERFGVKINPIIFIIINMFFLIVSSVFSYFFFPRWQDLLNYWTTKRKMSHKNKLIENKNKNISKRDEIQENHNDLESHKNHHKGYSTDITEWINTMFHETAALFISTLSTHGNKNIDITSEDIPDITIKKQNKKR